MCKHGRAKKNQKAWSVTDVNTHAAAKQSEPAHLRTLTMLAVVSTCLYGVIALLSWRFDFDSPTTLRPIVPVLILFATAFAGYLFATVLPAVLAKLPLARDAGSRYAVCWRRVLRFHCDLVRVRALVHLAGC